MNLTIVLVIAAAVGLIAIGIFAAQSLLVSGRTSQAAATIRPIDLEAFRNLIDPAENDYLRRRLPTALFLRVRWQRLRATAAYLQLTKSNAVVLMRTAEAALASADPRLASAARELRNDAALLQRNASFALLRIYVAMAFPASAIAAPVVDRYERLSGSAMLLGRLQNPAVPVRLSALR